MTDSFVENSFRGDVGLLGIEDSSELCEHHVVRGDLGSISACKDKRAVGV